MPEAKTFEEIAKTFEERVRRIVWCTVTTVDTKGRPFSRILHPIWEGAAGWIATGRQSLKAKHLAKNPLVAVSYWDPQHDTVIAQCRTWLKSGAVELKKQERAELEELMTVYEAARKDGFAAFEARGVGVELE